MKAMILAAGRGTRLGALTEQIPKCMLPIHGKPLLEHTLEWLRRFGVTQVVINLHHLPEVITDHFGDGSRWGVQITYSPEEHLLGTAGAVRNVAWFFDGPFLVWYGDNLSRCNLDHLAEFQFSRGGLGTIALHYRQDPTSSGIVGLDDQGRITRFLEKPTVDQVFSHWVSAGIFALDPDVLRFIPPEGMSDFGRDVFPAILAHRLPLYGYRLSDTEGLNWIDTPVDLARMQYGNWGTGRTDMV